MLGAVALSPGWANTHSSSANNSFWFSLVCGGKLGARKKSKKKQQKTHETKSSYFQKIFQVMWKKI